MHFVFRCEFDYGRMRTRAQSASGFKFYYRNTTFLYARQNKAIFPVPHWWCTDHSIVRGNFFPLSIVCDSFLCASPTRPMHKVMKYTFGFVLFSAFSVEVVNCSSCVKCFGAFLYFMPHLLCEKAKHETTLNRQKFFPMHKTIIQKSSHEQVNISRFSFFEFLLLFLFFFAVVIICRLD